MFGFFKRSIDKQELARREIKNVDLLLNEGECKLLPDSEYLLVDEIPAMYEMFVTGTWLDFFDSGELEAYQVAHQENDQRLIQLVAKQIQQQMDDESRLAGFTSWIEENKTKGPQYRDYFNTNWVLALQIQAILWYKYFLERTLETGNPFFMNKKMEIEPQRKPDKLQMSVLTRSNDGYRAITASFNDFFAEHNRNPSWSELMSYMVEQPCEDFLVKGKKAGGKVIELIIGDVNKPIDRAAFKKRFDRYFPESGH